MNYTEHLKSLPVSCTIILVPNDGLLGFIHLKFLFLNSHTPWVSLTRSVELLSPEFLVMSLPVSGTVISPIVKLVILKLLDGFKSKTVKLSLLLASAIIVFPCNEMYLVWFFYTDTTLSTSAPNWLLNNNSYNGSILTVERFNVKPWWIIVGLEQSITGKKLILSVKADLSSFKFAKPSISVSVYPPPPPAPATKPSTSVSYKYYYY